MVPLGTVDMDGFSNSEKVLVGAAADLGLSYYTDDLEKFVGSSAGLAMAVLLAQRVNGQFMHVKYATGLVTCVKRGERITCNVSNPFWVSEKRVGVESEGGILYTADDIPLIVINV